MENGPCIAIIGPRCPVVIKSASLGPHLMKETYLALDRQGGAWLGDLICPKTVNIKDTWPTDWRAIESEVAIKLLVRRLEHFISDHAAYIRTVDEIKQQLRSFMRTFPELRLYYNKPYAAPSRKAVEFLLRRHHPRLPIDCSFISWHIACILQERAECIQIADQLDADINLMREHMAYLYRPQGQT